MKQMIRTEVACSKSSPVCTVQWKTMKTSEYVLHSEHDHFSRLTQCCTTLHLCFSARGSRSRESTVQQRAAGTAQGARSAAAHVASLVCYCYCLWGCITRRSAYSHTISEVNSAATAINELFSLFDSSRLVSSVAERSWPPAAETRAGSRRSRRWTATTSTTCPSSRRCRPPIPLQTRSDSSGLRSHPLRPTPPPTRLALAEEPSAAQFVAGNGEQWSRAASPLTRLFSAIDRPEHVCCPIASFIALISMSFYFSFCLFDHWNIWFFLICICPHCTPYFTSPSNGPFLWLAWYVEG